MYKNTQKTSLTLYSFLWHTIHNSTSIIHFVILYSSPNYIYISQNPRTLKANATIGIPEMVYWLHKQTAFVFQLVPTIYMMNSNQLISFHRVHIRVYIHVYITHIHMQCIRNIYRFINTYSQYMSIHIHLFAFARLIYIYIYLYIRIISSIIQLFTISFSHSHSFKLYAT